MAGLVSTGSAESQNIMFNSAVLTLDSVQMIDITDVTLDEKYAEKSFRSLNSIHKRAIRRSTYEAMAKFSVIGTQSQKLLQYFYSSSSPDSTDVIYDPKDGQQTAMSTCMITVYTNDAHTTGFQYILTNPTIINFSKSFPTEDFAKVDIEIACTKFTSIRFVS